MAADCRQDSESTLGELLQSIVDREWEKFHEQIRDVPHSFVLEQQEKLTPNTLKRLKNVLESDIQVGFQTALETARAHNLMAYILFSLGEGRAALDEIEVALKAEGESHNLVSLANMAVIQWQLGRRPEAQTQVDKLLDMRRHAEDFDYQYIEVKARAELAFSYTRLGPSCTHIAVKVFTDVIAKARDPELWLWKFGLGLTKRRFLHVQIAPILLCGGQDAGQLEVMETLRLFLEVIQNCPCPHLKAKAFVEVAVLMKMRWTPEILKILDQQAKMTPLEACQRALALDDNDCSVLWKSGKVHRYERKLDEARRLLEKSVSLRPTSTGLHHLGLAYKAMATRTTYDVGASRCLDFGRGNRRGYERGRARQGNQGRWDRGGNSRQSPQKERGFENRGGVRRNNYGYRGTGRRGNDRCTLQGTGRRGDDRCTLQGTGRRGDDRCTLQGTGRRGDDRCTLQGTGRRGNDRCTLQGTGHGQDVERMNFEEEGSSRQESSGQKQTIDRGLTKMYRKQEGKFAPLNLACQSLQEERPGHSEPEGTWLCRETESTTGSLRETDEICDIVAPQFSQLRLVITPRDKDEYRKDTPPTSSSISHSQSRLTARGIDSHEPLRPNSHDLPPYDDSVQPTKVKTVADDDTGYFPPVPTSLSSGRSSVGISNPNQQLLQETSHQTSVKLLKGFVKSPTKESTSFSWDNKYIKKSVECLQKAVQLSAGDNTRAMYDLALVYRALGKLPEALELLEKIIQGGRQASMGPFDKVQSYEQAGLILIDMSKTEADYGKKQTSYDQGQSMLNMALLTASRLYPKMPRLPSMVKDVFQSFSALLKAADASTRNPHEKVREKARLFHLIKEHKHSIRLLNIVEAMVPGECGNPDQLRMFIQNYVGSEQYEEALTFIEILQQTSESGNIMGHFNDKNYVQKVYMLAARQDLLKTPNTMRHRFYFHSAFIDIFGSIAQSGTSAEDSATSEDEDGEGADETWDVMIIHERSARETADVLTSVLHDICGLNVTSLYKHVLLGRLEIDGVVHNISRSRLVVVLAGANKISKELRLYIQNSAMRPTTVTLLTEGDHVPTMLKTHRSRRCTLKELLDMSTVCRYSTEEADARHGCEDFVSSVCELFSFLIDLLNWSVILE